MPSRFSLFGLPGWNGPYPFFLFLSGISFSPSNGYVYLLTEPPTLLNFVNQY